MTPATDVTAATTSTGAVLLPIGPEDPQLVVPLPALASYDTAPLATAADIKDKDAPEIRYDAEIKGLADAGDGLEARYKALSALKGGGKAANTTQVSARAKEDEALVVRLLKSLGYYDATAVSTIETVPDKPGRLKAIVSAQPGRLYTLGSIDVKTAQTIPPDLVRSQLPLKVGDPIQADRIQGAEANVSLMLPQMGYPFVKVGERDILLDDEAQVPTGAYTLPVDTGPRASFGQLRTEGDAVFDIEHLNVFPRSRGGAALRQPYDRRPARRAGRDEPVPERLGGAAADRPHQPRRHRAGRPAGPAGKGPGAHAGRQCRLLDRAGLPRRGDLAASQPLPL
ncbi:hypothetical protein QP185_15115 [Sphingomonas aerolata]|uniref:POTRA domain-containing protein n=1 Tax=Sphingomonas aerolata TaxID=185951 RepID=UPI002FE08675